MTDGNPPRKKRWGMSKRRHSDHHLSDERGRTETDESEVCSVPLTTTWLLVMISLQRSSPPPSRARSSRGPFPLVRRLWATVTKSPSSQPAGRSLNTAAIASSSNTQHPISNQSSQVGAIPTLGMHFVRRLCRALHQILFQFPKQFLVRIPIQETRKYVTMFEYNNHVLKFVVWPKHLTSG